MGDMSALEQLYNNYYATICSVAYCRVRKKEDAQDIASVAMIKLCNVGDKHISNPNAFVYTLTVNCVKDFLKRKKPVYVEDLENISPAKENGNSIEFDIEKELGIEIVGDTKVKIAIEDDEEPWDIIPDDNLSNEVEKEIDDSVKEDYLDKK